MKYCIHISTKSDKLIKTCQYLNKIINNTPIDSVFCYVEDSPVFIDEARTQFNSTFSSHIKLFYVPKSNDLTNFNKTLAYYPDTDDIWIVTLNDSIIYPDSLIETYIGVIRDAPKKYAYGFFGDVFDTYPINDTKGLVHILDQTLSACYHRSYFNNKWAHYIAAISQLLDIHKNKSIIFSNWFAKNMIDRFVIDVPLCNIDHLKTHNLNYTCISEKELSSVICILQKHNLYFLNEIKETKETKETKEINEIKETKEINEAKETSKIPVIENMLQYYNLNRPIIKYEHIALLLESRFSPTYELLLRQVMRFLPANFRIVLMVAPEVIESWHQLAMRLLNGKLHPGLIVFTLKHTLTSVQDYNTIMLDINFWKQFSMYKKVLVFQTDTMIFKHGLTQYMKYDYIGAPWPLSYGLAKGVGNGGFSLRTIQAMIKCLEQKDKIIIPSYTNSEHNLKTFNGVHPEDVFYSFGMLQLNFSIASPNIASYFANESTHYNIDIIGCHQLEKFNKPLYNRHLYNSIIPYKHILHMDVGTHRYGWVNVKQTLDKLFSNPNGIELRSYGDVEQFSFSKKEWVGIFHLTPLTTKKYYDVCNVLNLRNRPSFIHNLQFCKGIFTLSKYITTVWKIIISKLELAIPVDTVYHPVGFDGEFDPALIDTIKTVVMVGSQLRRPSTLYKLDLAGFKKVWLPGRTLEKALGLLEEECEEFAVTLSEDEKRSVEILSLSNEDYDSLINTSFLIVHQVNASANNAIIEAISRNIPIFCNRLPATEEYIGKDYPLFFRSIQHLQELLQDKKIIRQAHAYLKAHQELKDRLTMDAFVSGILNSHITQQILTQTVPAYVERFNEIKF